MWLRGRYRGHPTPVHPAEGGFGEAISSWPPVIRRPPAVVCQQALPALTLPGLADSRRSASPGGGVLRHVAASVWTGRCSPGGPLLGLTMYYLPRLLGLASRRTRAHTHRAVLRLGAVCQPPAACACSAGWLDHRLNARSVVGGPGTATQCTVDGRSSNVLHLLASDCRGSRRADKGSGVCSKQHGERWGYYVRLHVL